MKRSFVQCAEIILEPGAELAALGGAVTLALCGSWDHDGPCRWPHLTSSWSDEDEGQSKARVIFAAEEGEENEVRALIDRALAGGQCTGPDGKLSRWQTTGQSAGVLEEAELALGAELVAHPSP